MPSDFEKKNLTYLQLEVDFPINLNSDIMPLVFSSSSS